MTQALNQHLYDSYGGFADGRLKKVVFDRRIAVHRFRDGRKIYDVCALAWVNVYESNRLSIVFARNYPKDKNIVSMMDALKEPVSLEDFVTKLGPLIDAISKAHVPDNNKSIYYSRRELSEDLAVLKTKLEDFLSM